MENIDLKEEVGRAVVAAVVAFLAALLLKAAGAGKWVVAEASGAAGAVAAVLLVP